FSPCNIPPCTVTPFGAIRIDDDGTPGQTTGTKIHNNNFAGNDTPFGVDDLTSASTATDTAAESNWWGCTAGPGNVGCDSVTANVDFDPFSHAGVEGSACEVAGSLAVTQVKIADNGPNGRIRLKADFVTPPTFTSVPPVTVRVQDGLGLDVMHEFGTCTAPPHIRCTDTAGAFKASFTALASNPGVFRVKVAFNKMTLNAPFMGPVTVTV